MSLFKKKKNELLEVEVSEKHVGLRIAALIILVVIGIGCLAYALISVLTVEKGWTTIEVDSGNMAINEELIFNYDIGRGEESPTNEWKKITSAYSEAANKAYRIFDLYQSYDDTVNMYTVNRSVGKELTVSSALYRAFELAQGYGNRYIYLAPIYSLYSDLCFSESDPEAAENDPYKNEDSAEYVGMIAGFAADPSAVDVKLLGNNKLMLAVSDEYKKVIEEWGIENVVDFSYLTNAFIVDYIADALMAKGYTKGNITSYDGYIRNMDSSGEIYAINIFDRVGTEVYTAATVKYSGATSIVSMRNYPLNSKESFYYYSYSSGEMAHRYTDIKTGKYVSSTDEMISYSHTKSCAEVAIQMSDVFIASEYDRAAVQSMCTDGVFSVWTEESTVFYNDKKLLVDDLFKSDERSYVGSLVE